jgi:hypothetical protein
MASKATKLRPIRSEPKALVEENYAGESLGDLELGLDGVPSGTVGRLVGKLKGVISPLAHDSNSVCSEAFDDGEFTVGDLRGLYWVVTAVARSLMVAKWQQEKKAGKPALRSVKKRGAA